MYWPVVVTKGWGRRGGKTEGLGRYVGIPAIQTEGLRCSLTDTGRKFDR